MVILMSILFIAAYILISLEHKIKINKAATALVTGMLLWTIYIFISPGIVPQHHEEAFKFYLSENDVLRELSLKEQTVSFVENYQLIEHVGDVAEIVFFLLGAMAVVELIDMHCGFSLITDRITTRNRKKLLWILVIISFFLSAIIDNLTTAIVMVTLLNKIIADKNERWLFASVVIIASNSGGAWSPIGDVTTILLWVKGTVTPIKLMEYVFIPSLVSVIIPLLMVSRSLHGEIPVMTDEHKHKMRHDEIIDQRRKITVLVMGISGLLMVPIFKNFTNLPPFVAIMLVLGTLWIITDLMYRRIPDNIPFHLRAASLIKRIDLPTLLFFMGILLAVAAIQEAGGLLALSKFLETKFNNIYTINIVIGFLSAIVDNVPLVAAALGLYPLVDSSTLSTISDPTFMAYFVPDGIYWHFLTYCAGVGGSLLIIGSAAGVVVMGIEKIHFIWYLKKISLMALLGYLGGAAAFILEVFLIHGRL